jgi:branched-subunit amino acid aminotransferase/4-amino-4-deoxychorismate lyase
MNRLSDGVAKIILTPHESRRACLRVSFEPPRPRHRAVKLLLTAYRPSAWRSIKSIAYLDSVVLLQRARALRLYDAVAVDRGELLETGTANLVAATRHQVCTPPADGRILPGILRARMLADPSLAVKEHPLKRSQLRLISEIVLTNCVRGVIPVRRIENDTGEVLWCASAARRFTRRATARWQSWLEQECSAYGKECSTHDSKRRA